MTPIVAAHSLYRLHLILHEFYQPDRSDNRKILWKFLIWITSLPCYLLLMIRETTSERHWVFICLCLFPPDCNNNILQPTWNFLHSEQTRHLYGPMWRSCLIVFHVKYIQWSHIPKPLISSHSKATHLQNMTSTKFFIFWYTVFKRDSEKMGWHICKHIEIWFKSCCRNVILISPNSGECSFNKNEDG